MYSVVNEIDVSCFFAVTQAPRGERATAALLLFAVCQRPLLHADPEDTLPEPCPRIFSESECKGTTIPRTDKIFPRFFFMKTQLFFADPHTGTCKAGGRKHEKRRLVQKDKENGKKGCVKRHFTDNQKGLPYTGSPFFTVHFFSSVYTSAPNAPTTSHMIAEQTFREVRQAR